MSKPLGNFERTEAAIKLATWALSQNRVGFEAMASASGKRDERELGLAALHFLDCVEDFKPWKHCLTAGFLTEATISRLQDLVAPKDAVKAQSTPRESA